jgi:hypothetical protein
MPAVHLHHIAYSDQTLREAPAGSAVLDNLAHERDDWREYWPIRRFLLTQPMEEGSWYGFLSPRFREKTGLDHAQAADFVRRAPAGTDVVTFCPQPDMSAFFLNVFEQQGTFDPEFIPACEAFLAAAGIGVKVGSMVMDSRHIVFSNYFVARRAFWRAWLDVNEKLFALCEGADSPLKRSLTLDTGYPGAVQRKVFVMERVASLLLAINPAWRVRAYDTFACAWSDSGLSRYRLEAVLSDALKIAMREQGFREYASAYSTLRTRLK